MKIFLLTLLLIGNAFGQSNIGNWIDYKIKPIPKTDRTDLEISTEFEAEKDKLVTIKLPIGCYGTPTIHRYVAKFEGKNGTAITKSEKENERIIKPNKYGKISLRYILSFDPAVIEDSAFAPKIHPEYFSIAGCQWLLRFDDDEAKRDVSIRIIGAPKNWRFHSSIAENPRKIKLRASFDDLISARIGGGGDSRTFFVKNKPVSIFIKGDFEIPKEEIFDAAEKIVRVQRDWFADYEQPFYHVVINERKGVVAGTAIKNQFVCFVQKEVERDRLNMILAHEMFHNWLPVKMDLKIPEGDHSVRYEWFFEGFTEYFAKKILFDAGLLSPEKFAELINKDIHNLADNPYKNIIYKDFLAMAKAREFTSIHKKLSYYRGVLIALNWETKLRKSKTNLSDFIRSLYKFVTKKGGKISEEEFFTLAKNYRIDAKNDFEKYILEGNSIEVDSNALGEKFTSIEKELPLFEAGFSIRESEKEKKITGVIRDSAAYKAGLRNGMEYVRADNWSRFSNAWNSEKPLTVVVKIDGKEKEFKYFPHGKPIKLLQFQMK